mmetsp:Transcript_60570/g.174752  ORF Transcript_60570/g.174752 Transcript_60570/m.174752 type:complete len:231 (-) Transcript_60570:831-1523(-)
MLELVPHAHDPRGALLPDVRRHVLRLEACGRGGPHKLRNDPEHERGLEEVCEEVRSGQAQRILQERSKARARRLHREMDGIEHPEPHGLRGLLRKLDQGGNDAGDVGALHCLRTPLTSGSKRAQDRAAQQGHRRPDRGQLGRRVRSELLEDPRHDGRVGLLVVHVEQQGEKLDVQAPDCRIGLLHALDRQLEHLHHGLGGRGAPGASHTHVLTHIGEDRDGGDDANVAVL